MRWQESIPFIAVLVSFLFSYSLEAYEEEAQPFLPTVALRCGDIFFSAEVAHTPSQQKIGLMFRSTLPKNQGMLFIRTPPARASFWMKNTSLALSIAYLNRHGYVLEIHSMDPFSEKKITSYSNEVAYALEMEQGWFSSKKIGPGSRIEPVEMTWNQWRQKKKEIVLQ